MHSPCIQECFKISLTSGKSGFFFRCLLEIGQSINTGGNGRGRQIGGGEDIRKFPHQRGVVQCGDDDDDEQESVGRKK